ncbi:type 4 fimbrial biogenesis protein PilZ [Legionella antarctica]|uniref:Type 4 fimbrial biogenesis protein PilZ n=1 Tax=Legionella antarctica TaxID=2708020 RepID=A0A6F8T5B5_9GAMM|nr:PilZ domain-containing protein [Legionella antarctica]BCA95347.1 type 4 fimbrial biogenesis protein PilZ [Legionella antarctica]
MTESAQLVNCTFPSEALLYNAYMPFVKGGGLFFRTKYVYPLGKELQLSLKIISEIEPYLIDVKVVWVTPKGAQGNKPPGIGVQFIGENSRYLCNKIETHLAGMLKSTQPTDTI